jgi:hypothetical protein
LSHIICFLSERHSCNSDITKYNWTFHGQYGIIEMHGYISFSWSAKSEYVYGKAVSVHLFIRMFHHQNKIWHWLSTLKILKKNYLYWLNLTLRVDKVWGFHGSERVILWYAELWHRGKYLMKQQREINYCFVHFCIVLQLSLQQFILCAVSEKLGHSPSKYQRMHIYLSPFNTSLC